MIAVSNALVHNDHDRTPKESGEFPQGHLGASMGAIQAHYDVGNDFYASWLDPEMTYSCALYENDDDLVSAQTRKLDYHVQKARLSGAARALDIGCGWGSGLRRLTSVHGVKNAVGLTLSDAQAEWARRSRDPRIEVRVESWEDHRPSAPYDGIICIGAFEHFALPEYAPDQKIAAYRRFFERSRELMNPEGYLSLQTIAFGSGKYIPDTPLAEIFPESHLPRLSEIAAGFDKLFEVEVVRNDRNDYVTTLKAWLALLESNWDTAVRTTSEAAAERYRRYLQFSVMGFSYGYFDLLRLSLRARPPRSR